jgi:DNA-binding LacI/PurR family transcriptional regulator
MKEEMGRVAGKLLFESILEGRNYSLNVTLPVELIERESVKEIL